MDRPLTGEPLAVDLVDTRWNGPDGVEDLLATSEGLAQWLAERGVVADPDERVRGALVQARDALQRSFAGEPGADDDLNAILARALIVRSVSDGHVHEHPVFADEAWRPAWLAVDDCLRLRQVAPEGVRQCGHPACVLYFYDPTGRRRWCSMARCGNRAKAQRHYTRQRREGVA